MGTESNTGMSIKDEREVDALRIVVSFDKRKVDEDLDEFAKQMGGKLGMVIPDCREYMTKDEEVVAVEMELAPEFIDFHTLMNVYSVMSEVSGFRDLFVTLEKLNINNALKRSL